MTSAGTLGALAHDRSGPTIEAGSLAGVTASHSANASNVQVEAVEAEAEVVEAEEEEAAEGEECASPEQASQKQEEAPPAWPKGAVVKPEKAPPAWPEGAVVKPEEAPPAWPEGAVVKPEEEAPPAWPEGAVVKPEEAPPAWPEGAVVERVWAALMQDTQPKGNSLGTNTWSHRERLTAAVLVINSKPTNLSKTTILSAFGHSRSAGWKAVLSSVRTARNDDLQLTIPGRVLTDAIKSRMESRGELPHGCAWEEPTVVQQGTEGVVELMRYACTSPGGRRSQIDCPPKEKGGARSDLLAHMRRRAAEIESEAGYFGVSLANPGKAKPYKVEVRRGGKVVNLGSFATAEEAALCVARSPEGQAAATAVGEEGQGTAPTMPAGAILKEEGAVPPMPPGAYVKDEEVAPPPMPPGAFFKEEEVVPPMPPDAAIKEEHEFVVKEEERSDDRPKRRRSK